MREIDALAQVNSIEREAHAMLRQIAGPDATFHDGQVEAIRTLFEDL